MILGGVQFGQAYGVSNSINSEIDDDELKQILEFAFFNNIRTIDTAQGYGNSESRLGRHSNGFEFITKITIDKDDELTIKESLFDSLAKLRKKQLYGVLIHRSSDLNDSYKRKELFKALDFFKSENLIKNVGISIYDPQELVHSMKFYDFDIVQAPLNIFDTRLIRHDIYNDILKKNIKIHARSVFLQGLLLMKIDRIPAYFSPWMSDIKRVDNFFRKQDINKINYMINFVESFQNVESIIGVQSFQELKDIVESTKISNHTEFYHPDLSDSDIELINPSKWSV